MAMEKYFSSEKNVLILMSLMKGHGIKKVVTSPGVANITFVASIQRDPYFEIYSSVDERSAAYIACGMAEESGEPVAISCTGATASRNYMPGLTEAYYRNLPILAITSARDITWVGQNSPQQIDRSVQPKDIVKYRIHLPTLHSEQEENRYTTLINKALLELRKGNGGPVHINLTNGYTGKYETKELPNVRIVKRYTPEDELPQITNGKIGIFVGAHSKWNERLFKSVEEFCTKYNAVVLCDHLSNYHGSYGVFHNIITCQRKYNANCCSFDLMIYMGNIHGTDYERISPKEVWRVNIDGEVRDPFGGLTAVFEMSEALFFESYNSFGKTIQNTFVKEWADTRKELCANIPKIPFSNIWVAQQTLPKMKDGSVIHFGIQNSLRSWNYFIGPKKMLGYSNTGGFGIDGCVSSLIGSAMANLNKVFYGVVGDLAFFYDMNALGNRHIGKNVRLIVVNNGCGQQFRNPYSAGGCFGEYADKFIAAAGHYGNKSVRLLKHFAEDLGFIYLSASNKEEYLNNLNIFLDEDASQSIVMEVFTDTSDESDAITAICNLKSSIKLETGECIRNIIKSALGEKGTEFVRKILH